MRPAAQELADLAWAFAITFVWHTALFAPLAGAAEQFSLLEFARTKWVFATVAEWDAALFVLLARAAEHGGTAPEREQKAKHRKQIT